MRMLIAAVGFGLLSIGPAAAQVPNVQQLLQGLTTGNQGQDTALRDAFERGYQKGRQDEAQMRGSDRGGNARSNNDSSYRQAPPDNRGYGDGDQGGGTYRR